MTLSYLLNLAGEALMVLCLAALGLVFLFALSVHEEPISRAQWEARLASRHTLEGR